MLLIPLIKGGPPGARVAASSRHAALPDDTVPCTSVQLSTGHRVARAVSRLADRKGQLGAARSAPEGDGRGDGKRLCVRACLAGDEAPVL